MPKIPSLVRTPAEIREAREALGLSTEALARMVLVDDGSTIRRWEAGTHVVPGPVSVLLETAMDFLRQQEEISQQIARLQSGEIRSATWMGHDDTDATIKRLSEARASLEHALVIMTRRPPREGQGPTPVHWYNLKRLTYEYKPGRKDEWSLPGETSPERALAYFERDAGFSRRLAICEDTDRSAEFLLEQREVLRTQFGASQRLRAGDLVKTFAIRHV
jgi:transcriptional regulator with XRE-family HTH domain